MEKVTNSLNSTLDNWERVWYIGIQINFNKRLRLSMTKNEDMTLIILGRRGGGSVPPICHIEMNKLSFASDKPQVIFKISDK